MTRNPTVRRPRPSHPGHRLTRHRCPSEARPPLPSADYLSLCAIWDRLGVGHRSSGSGSCGEDLASLGGPDGRTVLEVTDP